MPLSVCTITGTAYYANGTLGDANIYITADQVTLNGSVLGTAAQTFYAEPVGGIITLVLPRGSTARLKGTVRGFQDYVTVAIPNAPTANLEDLIAVSSVPTAGIIIQDDAVALANKAGTLNFGDGLTATETSPGVVEVEAAAGASVNPTSTVIPYNNAGAFADSPITASVPGSMVNGITVTGGASGASPEVAATGAGANLDLKLSPKGTGYLILPNGSGGIALNSNGSNIEYVGNKIYMRPVAGYSVAFNGITGATEILNNAYPLTWPNGGIVSSAEGVLEFNNGTVGNTGAILLRGRTFANLPATPIAGMEATVTDSNTQTWGATVAGGGAFTVKVWYNGAAWTVIGK